MDIYILNCSVPAVSRLVRAIGQKVFSVADYMLTSLTCIVDP
jgi:hypothetical protein